ncbi:UNVERIFIED_CONTAM: hypothetical protein HDU68_005766 [Siphonaria sp. JEL0065]|nr:hypothetical protein HDU68_005766 [Siphonaria sp. JEL0065]
MPPSTSTATTMPSSHKRKDNSSDDGFSSDQMPAHKDKEQKGRAGRKPLPEDAVPASHQVARQRANQRAFRERKANELKTLQDEVKELRAKLENNASSSSSSNADSSVLLDRIAALESENMVLKQFAFTFMKQAPPVSTAVPFTSANPFVFPDPLLSQFLLHQQQQLQPQDLLASLNPLQQQPVPSLASESPCPSIEDCLTNIPPIPSTNMLLPFDPTPTNTTTDFSALLDFSTYRDTTTTTNNDPLLPTLQNNDDDLLDFLNSTPAPPSTHQQDRIPLAIKLEISTPQKHHILSVNAKLKTIPSLNAQPDLVDDLCDAFATCSVLGYVPNHHGMEEEGGGGERPEDFVTMERLKQTVLDACKGRPEDEKAATKILSVCKEEHPVVGV